MAEIHGTFEFPDGLTPRQSKQGGLSQLLSDQDGNLVGHGHFVPDDDDGVDYSYNGSQEDDSLTSNEDAEALGAIIGLAIVAIYGAVKAAPHLKRWWLGRVLPRLRSRWPFKKQTVPELTTPLALISAVSATPADFSAAVEVALEDSRRGMTSEEAQRRLAATLAAAAFIAEQVRMLSNARLEDGPFSELQSAMDKLTTQQATDAIKRMLSADTSLLDEDTTAELMSRFGSRGIPGREAIRDVLRFTDEGDDAPELELA